jgi:hypothetical protein
MLNKNSTRRVNSSARNQEELVELDCRADGGCELQRKRLDHWLSADAPSRFPWERAGVML